MYRDPEKRLPCETENTVLLLKNQRIGVTVRMRPDPVFIYENTVYS
jgi:hypothetical protein